MSSFSLVVLLTSIVEDKGPQKTSFQEQISIATRGHDSPINPPTIRSFGVLNG